MESKRSTKKGIIVHTVKRRGHLEQFDERKVYASIYSACASAHIPHREGEKIADAVCKDILPGILGKKTVAASAIFERVARTLKKYDANAAFMYKTHHDIS